MSDLKPMTRERFAELLDAYGAEPARWPEHERSAALALLAQDAEAQRVQRAAAALDQLLDRGTALQASAALQRAVAEIPLRAPRAAALPWLLGSFARAALSAVLVLALGVVAGVASGDPSAEEPAAETAVNAVDGQQAQSEDPLDTLVELAFNGAADEEQVP